jgi:hypothetical protein
MLYKDVIEVAREALRLSDRENFVVAVRVAQSMAQGNAELAALLDSAVTKFPSPQALVGVQDSLEQP